MAEEDKKVLIRDSQIDPQSLSVLLQGLQIPYTATQPTYTPNYNQQVIYKDGSNNYWYYVYANGAWRSIQLGSSSIYGRLAFTTGGGQSINDITVTKVAFNVASFSSGVTADTTNNRFTILTAGKYAVSASIWYNQPADQGLYQAYIYVNGGENSRGALTASGTFPVSPGVSDILSLSVNDYVEIYTFHNSGVAKTVSPGGNLTYFNIHSV